MSGVPMMLMYAGKMIAVLLLVYLLAVLTPKLARALSKSKKKRPTIDHTNDARNEVRPIEDEDYTVTGLYDPQTSCDDNDCNCSDDCSCDSDCGCGSDSDSGSGTD